MSVQIEGLDKIQHNLMRKAAIGTIEKIEKRLSLAGNVLYQNVVRHASLTDEHTQEWLDTHGHPYAKRHRTRTGNGSFDRLHQDDSLVHTQSGNLLKNIEKVESFGLDESSVAVGVSEDKVYYIGDLSFGNMVMRPRPFLQHGLMDSKDEIERIMKGGK